MTCHARLWLAAMAVLGGSASLYPLRADAVPVAPQASLLAEQRSDTATVRLHISGMTCGTCPVTARVALKKLRGVFDARVTLYDSLGVVRYDPRKVTPAQIAAGLTRLTGYGAQIIEGRPKATR